jgi:hypothetical protein
LGTHLSAKLYFQVGFARVALFQTKYNFADNCVTK